MEQKVLLDVKNLRTSFFTDAGEVKSVNDVSFHVNEHEVVAVVGESGSGKSVTQLSVMQLIRPLPARFLAARFGSTEKICSPIRPSRCAMCAATAFP